MRYIKEYKETLWTKIGIRDFVTNTEKKPLNKFSKSEIEKVKNMFSLEGALDFYTNEYRIDITNIGDNIIYSLCKRDDEWYYVVVNYGYDKSGSYFKCDGFDALLDYLTTI